MTNAASSPGKTSGGLSKRSLLFAVILSLLAGFAAGWLVRDARETREIETAGNAAGGIDPDIAAQITKFKAHLAEDPDDATAWVSLGHMYFDTNQPGPAVEAYTKYLELKPGDADVLTDMGVMHRDLGQPAKALECFNAALAINPNHEIASFDKGIVYLSDLNDKPHALAAFEALLAINPNAKAPGGRPVSEIIRELRPQASNKPGMLIDK